MDTAAAAADAITGAHLEALHVTVDPRSLIAATEEVDFQLLRERAEGTAYDRAAATRKAYELWLDRNGRPPFEWKELSGDESDEIGEEAKHFDVLVLARPHNADGVDALYAALYWIDRPFFLAPNRRPEQVSLVDKVVIAWSDTPQCRRAIAGIVPWLRAAHATVILLVAEHGGMQPQEIEGLDGIPYETVIIDRDDEKLGDQIVTEAKRLGATLLVTGAHRRNELVEWLVGHTTDQIVRHDDLTLFLAH